MGIPELWEVLRPAFDERIPLEKLVDQFVRDLGRTPRVAIDGYMFMFQSDHGSIVAQDKKSILIQNFMSKVLALIGLNVSVLVVFDGVMKPDKSGSGPALNYEEELVKFERRSDFAEQNPFVEELKEVLLVNRVEYFQAAGEAEAQCAFIQKLGIVDYVISNDVDTLVFGATRILRNFNRFAEDTASSPVKKQGAVRSKYYVTPVDMAKVEKVTGLSEERLVFLASMRGGDYSSGVDKIGIINAKNMALCGTSKALYYHRQKTKIELKQVKKPCLSLPPPDFAIELCRCFKSSKERKQQSVLLRPWESRRRECERRQMLAAYLLKLNSHLQGPNRDIFGRNVTIKEPIKIDEYFTLLYMFPFVRPQLPIFLPDTLSSGELATNTLLDIDSREAVRRCSMVSNINLNGNDTHKVMAQTHFFVPATYCWQMRYVAFKLLSSETSIRINKDKIEDDLQKLMLKFNPGLLFNRFPESSEARRRQRSPEKNDDSDSASDSLWVPRSLMELFYPRLVAVYDQKKKDDAYFGKRKCSLRQTTLDMLENSPTKKQKNRNSEFNIKGKEARFEPVPFKSVPELRAMKSSPKKPVRRSSPKKKKEPALGQQRLDMFLKPRMEKVKERVFIDITNTLDRDEDSPFIDLTSD
ncbi:uncharacterized protein LODBEIA_P10370 [Lodderomyces beijingensis]|uniref:XPG-I domain-containing protein n=1 Tax=Lodderomyces beijingensis TaxID=1775926 RepID=A0ABP0ZGT8_9ASCO